MKKNLIISSLILLSFLTNAQVFDFENFESYDDGDFLFPSETEGIFVGPNGWRAFAYDDNYGGEQSSDNLGPDNFQIVIEGDNKYFRVLSPNNITGSRIIYKDGFPEAWSNREIDNNVFRVDIDFMIEPTTVGQEVVLSMISSYEDNLYTLAGISFNTFTKEVVGLCAGSSQYFPEIVTLSTEEVTYEPNTIYSISFAYDYTTKKIAWYSEDLGINKVHNGTSSLEPNEFSIYVPRLTEPSTPTAIYIDNVNQEFTNSINLTIDTEDIVLNNNNLKIYPNPAKDMTSIELPKTFNKNNTIVEVSNMAGEIVIKKLYTPHINISQLSDGMYVLKISDGNNILTQKLVKK